MSDLEALGLVAAKYLRPRNGCGGCVVTLATDEHIRHRCVPCLTRDLTEWGAMLDAEDEGKADIDGARAWAMGQEAN